jgi:site-specific DNA-methyltransferase (adenine-specific)
MGEAVNRVLFSSASPHWQTPSLVYDDLNAEFHFTLDPCPLGDAEWKDGTYRSWSGERVFCNPPYGSGITKWLMKAREADCAVFLLPARTDTKWWHEYALQADEIRFIRGRLRFGNSTNSAPFPSVVLVYRKE